MAQDQDQDQGFFQRCKPEEPKWLLAPERSHKDFLASRYEDGKEVFEQQDGKKRYAFFHYSDEKFVLEYPKEYNFEHHEPTMMLCFYLLKKVQVLEEKVWRLNQRKY
jgi:hypothetical protein